MRKKRGKKTEEQRAKKMEQYEKPSSITKARRKGRNLPNDLKILTCLDEALDTYGESVKQVVYWNLETLFGVQKESIPEHPEKFVETLEKIFGSAASLVEKKIVKRLAELGNKRLDSPGEDLSTVLQAARHFRKEELPHHAKT